MFICQSRNKGDGLQLMVMPARYCNTNNLDIDAEYQNFKRFLMDNHADFKNTNELGIRIVGGDTWIVFSGSKDEILQKLERIQMHPGYAVLRAAVIDNAHELHHYQCSPPNDLPIMKL